MATVRPAALLGKGQVEEIAALERWVEQGTAPDRIIATHYHPDHVGGSLGGWEIEGVRELHGCRYRVIPDRIEAGTLAPIAGKYL